MGYKDPPDEEQPSFAPFPKPHVPPPTKNEPANVDHEPVCVWFYYQKVFDPVSNTVILPPPTKGTWDPDHGWPAGVNNVINCDEMEEEDPGKLYCITKKSPGPGQNDLTFCAKLYAEDWINLNRIYENKIASPVILDYLSGLAGRLGIATDDPYLLFSEYDLNPLGPDGKCEDCQKWWVGCVVDEDSICEYEPVMVVYNNNLLTDPKYSNGVVFSGNGAYFRAAAFYNDILEQIVYICYKSPYDGIKSCLPCSGYCNGGYLTEKECECSCLPEAQRPDDCCDDVVCSGQCTWDGTGGNEWDLIVPCAPLDIQTGESTGCCTCDPPAELWNNLGVTRNMPCKENTNPQ